MRIGIDVGGTNTDAVLMDGVKVAGSVKRSTRENVTDGIKDALESLREATGFDPSAIEGVMIGTTHFINALIEANRLAPTAAIRLCLPATAALPPLTAWPNGLTEAISGRSYMVSGGHEFDGREIAALDVDQIKQAAADMGNAGIRSVAITSVFSPVNHEFEEKAAEILTEELPGIAVSLSNKIGRVGLLERENATIINAALRELAEQVVDGLVAVLDELGINAPLFLTQNDGTLMSVDVVRQYPVSTFASGPTNSMRGAAALTGLTDCAVVDVGGTTSDIGVLRNGFPREANTAVEVAGVRTNFRMPDVVSIGIGGGSRVHKNGSVVGPDSSGYRIKSEALVFGGDTLTATDLAVAAGRVEIGDPSLVAHLDKSMVQRGLEYIAQQSATLIDSLRTSPDPMPVVAVGGGSILLPDHLEGIGSVSHPENHSVANAVGAAISQVSGEVDRIFPIGPGERKRVIDQAMEEAASKATAAGALEETVQIVEVDEVPIPYLPGNASRVRVKAVGELGHRSR
ncbi:hydantoinase/oxoprolinase N-terminal domain-containing protein [Brevibacterium ravenspurgense]|uniref:hydantoinase/oxoprolinase N-terminal domain-containing protein n=1 Tax=Brevibacterium ravenspurgense TaxID=479117 RepID=UPI000784DD2A|nr:hydantoinase/oxoprolinase family protein [Brevibacterium ravenspurgense]